MSVSTALKSVVKRLPRIKELVAERDRLRQENAELVAERDRLRQENAELVAERDRLRQEKAELVAERDRLRQENAELVAERDRLRQENAELVAERDRLRQENAELVAERDRLQRECGFVPPGHFYSPIPSLSEIKREESRIFGSVLRSIPGIELHESEQLKLLEHICQYYQSMPFPLHKTEGLRYYFENPMYQYSDAIFLYCMIRYLKPRKIIEIGSGFSSCAILDTNELFFDGLLKLICIEPYPALLLSLIEEEDKNKIQVIPQRLQDVGLDIFETLEANDILFVDSTHVSKIGSDVNHLFFAILPVLSSGVHIHLHDVFFPFEYPKDWIYEGRAWNEIYMLRAFLQSNNEFRVVLMNTFLAHFYEPFFRERMPLCLKNTGGSIWIRKE